MPAEVGSAYVSIIPSARGFGRALQRELGNDLNRAGRDAGRRLGDGIEAEAGGRGKRIGQRLIKGLDSGLAGLAAPARLATFTAAALSAGSAAATLTTQLVPVAGLAAALPAAVAGGVAAFGALRLALAGTGKAFSAALGGDAAKFTASLAGLSPAARDTARELRALKPALDDLRNSTQQAFFAPLTGQVTRLGSALARPLRTGLSGIASELGKGASAVAGFARQARTVDALATIFAAVRKSIAALSPALTPVLAGLRDLATAVIGVFPGLASGAASAARSFGAWAQQAAASGKALGWVQNAVATLRQLGRITANLGQITGAAFRAAGAGGGDLLGLLERLTGQASAFTNSTHGQQVLGQIFTELARAARTAAPAVASLARDLGGLLATMNGANPGAALTGFATSLGLFARALTAVITATPGGPAVFTALATSLGALAAVRLVSSPILGFASALTKVPAAVTSAREGMSAIKTGATTAATTLGKVRDGFVSSQAAASAFSGRAGTLGGALRSALTGAGGMTRTIGSQIATLTATMGRGAAAATVMAAGFLRAGAAAVLAAARMVIMRTITIAIRAATLTWTAVQWLLNAALTANPIGLIVVAIGALIAGIVLAWQHSQTFRTIVTGAFNAIKTVVVGVVSVIVGFVRDHWRLLLAILGGPLGLAVALVTRYWGLIRAATAAVWRAAVAVVRGAIAGVRAQIGLLASIPGRVAAWFGAAKNGAARGLLALVALVRGIPSRVTSALGSLGRLLFGAGRNIISGLVAGIRSMIGNVRGAISTITGTIRSYLPFSPAKQGPLSGSGNPENSGRSIGRMLAHGLDTSHPLINAAAARIAAATQISTRPGTTALALAGVSAGQGTTYNIHVTPQQVALDEQGLLHTMRVAELRARVGRPR